MAPMTPRLKILSGKSPVPSACGFSLLDPYPPLPSLVQLQFPGRVPRSAWAYLERISSLARPFPPSPTLRCSHRRTTTFVFILFYFFSWSERELGIASRASPPARADMSEDYELMKVVVVGGNPVSAFLSWRLQATNACDVTLVWKTGYEHVSQYGISFK